MASLRSHHEMLKNIRNMVDNSERIVLEDADNQHRAAILQYYDRVRNDLQEVEGMVERVLDKR